MLENMNRVQKSRTTILILFYLYFVNCQSHVENVALTGKCNMTERFKNTGDCSKAIDNMTNLTLGFTSRGPENCIHTSVTSPDKCLPFWQLILNEEYTITNITIYNRVGWRGRLTYTNVTVNGNLCKSFGSDVSTIKDVNTFQCSSPIRGRTVTISRHYPTCTNDDNYTLNLCEVQVWVCSKGWYGHDCNSACSSHCSSNTTCDQYDGSCPQAAGQGNQFASAVDAIVGSAIGITVVLSAVVLLTLVIRRRRNSLRNQSTVSSVRPPLGADLTDLQVQYLSGHTQDVGCLNSTYETFDRNALYENTQELSI